MRPIVLASTSRYRRELVARLKVPIESVAPALDEEVEKVRVGPLAPDALAIHLAREKARSLAAARPEALVIGSDQLVDLDGKILGKPHAADRAVQQLLAMAGRTHRLVTAVAIHDGRANRTEEAVSVHEMTMRPITEREARRYVALDEPLDCAGSYRVESLGVALFERMRGDDFTAIVGLPLTLVVTLLARHGVNLLEDA